MASPNARGSPPRPDGRGLPLRRLKRLLPVLFPYTVFVFLALVSWNRWIEPFVDSGRELMVPRRVSQGEALYREVHFHHGPLAPYAGAVLGGTWTPRENPG